MKKKDEIQDPGSCLNRADPEEFLFVLRAKDRTMPDTIRFWAKERVRLGLNRESDPKITTALKRADEIEKEQNQNLDYEI